MLEFLGALEQEAFDSMRRAARNLTVVPEQFKTDTTVASARFEIVRFLISLPEEVLNFQKAEEVRVAKLQEMKNAMGGGN